MQRAKCGEMQSSHLLPSRASLPLHLHWGTNMEVLCPSSFGFFMKTSLWRYGWITGHWWLNSFPRPSPLLRALERYWKSQPSNLLVGSTGSQPPFLGYLGVFLKSLHLRNKMHTDCSVYSGNSRNFRSFVPEMGWRPNMYFLLQITISHMDLLESKGSSKVLWPRPDGKMGSEAGNPSERMNTRPREWVQETEP